MTWTYSNQSQTVAHRVLPSGAYESRLVAAIPNTESIAPFAAQAAPVPSQVSMAQAQIALIRAGVSLSSVSSLIEAIPNQQTKDEARIWWEKSNAVERTHPMVALLAPGLGLSPSQVDALFIAAASI